MKKSMFVIFIILGISKFIFSQKSDDSKMITDFYRIWAYTHIANFTYDEKVWHELIKIYCDKKFCHQIFNTYYFDCDPFLYAQDVNETFFKNFSIRKIQNNIYRIKYKDFTNKWVNINIRTIIEDKIPKIDSTWLEKNQTIPDF